MIRFEIPCTIWNPAFLILSKSWIGGVLDDVDVAREQRRDARALVEIGRQVTFANGAFRPQEFAALEDDVGAAGVVGEPVRARADRLGGLVELRGFRRRAEALAAGGAPILRPRPHRPAPDRIPRVDRLFGSSGVGLAVRNTTVSGSGVSIASKPRV